MIASISSDPTSGKKQLEEAFAAELDALQCRLRSSISSKDISYIRIAEFAGRGCTLLGFATAWWIFNPLSIFLIAVGQVARWGIAHHVLHRAFDGVQGVPRRFRSNYFGKGWRRLLDWNDWMLPAGFQHEHNVHHVYTGGSGDPDVVEANLEFIRQSPRPRWCKYLMAITIAVTWRLSYYAPGTFKQLRRKEQGLSSTRFEFTDLFYFKDIFIPMSKESCLFWMTNILPYAITRFVLAPALFLPFGLRAAFNVFATVVAAELLTNAYTFILIASSHTGDDIYRFNIHSKGRPEFYLRQFLGTVNYKRGPAIRDFLQIWINYQIEHHIFPNLPPSKYAECTHEVERLCNKYGVPYRSERLRRRSWRMLDIIIGKATMPRLDGKTEADCYRSGPLQLLSASVQEITVA